MKYLITGATGFIGAEMCKKLAAEGHTIHALYRSESKTNPLQRDGIILFKGDILDRKSLDAAAEGCDGVFHVAAFAKPWHKDPQAFYRYNVEGAANVFEAARNAGAKRVVFTSTAGVINPSKGAPTSENTPRSTDYFTHYERSKAQAEELANGLNSDSFSIVTVNPTRVYGPGLLSDSNGVTRMLGLYLDKKFRMIPGDGKSIGNYVFIDDVVNGHILAMQNGVSGERYILGGENASFLGLFDKMGKATGTKLQMFKIPVWVMNLAARAMEIRANLTGAPPLLTPPWVRKYLYNWELSIEKAEKELGYKATTLEEGLSATVKWILEKRGQG